MNLSYLDRAVGNFRVNIFRQRGTISLVIRYVRSHIPSFEELKLPPVLLDLVMEKRGLIILAGATGSGKSTTLAAMIDYRNTQPLRAHPDDRGSDRIPVRAQEEHRQPARDRRRHPRPTKWRWRTRCARRPTSS